MNDSQDWTDQLPQIERKAADVGIEPIAIRVILLLRASGLYARLLGPKAVIDLLAGTGLPTDPDALAERLQEAERGFADILPDGEFPPAALEIVERHLVDPVTAGTAVEPPAFFPALARAAGECFLAVSGAPDSPLDSAQLAMIGCRPLVGRNPIPLLVPGRRYAFADGVFYQDGHVERP